jgi:diguanylate cyclase (GGDEF)-like protein
VHALAAGAHDAIMLPATAGELAARVLVWTRIAAQDRQGRVAIAALVDRMRQLETSIGALERTNSQLRELAHQDELTGLGNRRSFAASLEYSLEYAARYGGPLSLMLLDLDGMKKVNDQLGHPAGDAALRRVAEVLRASTRTVDHAARLGGDEFGIVMPATRVADAAQVAERIRDRIEGLLLPGAVNVRLTASLGLAAIEQPAGQPPRAAGAGVDQLIGRADSALYAAKRAGKNRVLVDGVSSSLDHALGA